MRSNRRGGGLWTWSALLGAALATVGVAALAQQARPLPGPQDREKAGEGAKAEEPGKKGGLRLQPKAPPEDLGGEAADPLAPGEEGAPPAADPAAAPKAAPDAARPPRGAPAGAQAPAPAIPEWPFHYRFRLGTFDGSSLAARYYPSQLGVAAPVVLMIHEGGPGRSGKDFEDPIAELDNQGLARHLQELGYASLVLDRRGRGDANAAGAAAVADLQAAYQFLLDRHNRRELNIAKLGVLALGDGANLALAWASTPGAAVAIEGRISDIGALALISPSAEFRNARLGPIVASLAPRVPMLLMAGQEDRASAQAIEEVRQVVDRQRLSRTALLDARLHGYNLLRFTPEATQPILRFLENTIKIRADEWEPRYNLKPVAFANVEIVDPDVDPAPVPPEGQDQPGEEAPAEKRQGRGN